MRASLNVSCASAKMTVSHMRKMIRTTFPTARFHIYNLGLLSIVNKDLANFRLADFRDFPRRLGWEWSFKASIQLFNSTANNFDTKREPEETSNDIYCNPDEVIFCFVVSESLQ
jgi:hypothetical protein